MGVELSQTVIYTVKISGFNCAAWYKDSIGKNFECILDIVDKSFQSGQEIVFKVISSYYPVKYIKQNHCSIIKQRIATHKELLKHYGTENKTDRN